MREYCPDRWVLLKVTHPEHGSAYKVFATWFGGYTGSDSWKLSSGCTSIILDDEVKGLMYMPQYSGSTYRVHKDNYGTNMYTHGVLTSWIKDLADKPELGSIEVMDENFDLAYIPVL